ncbi:hypothetical protein ES703_104572 [subsurface metagenome]
MLREASWLYQHRGTYAGLEHYLRLATDCEPEIMENVDGAFSFRVILHTGGKPIDERMVESIIEFNRPAHTVYTLEIDTSKPPEPPPTEAEPLVIGGAFPLTGVYSAEAATQKEGAILAVEEQNAAGGVLGRPIEFVIRDTELKAEVALRRIEELVTTHKAQAIVGILHGGIEYAVNDWCKKRHIPFFHACVIMPGAAAKDVVGPGTFGPILSTETAYVVADVAMTDLGWNTFYSIYADYSYGIEQDEDFTKWVEDHGGQVVGHAAAAVGTVEFGPFLSKAVASGADALFMVNFGGDQVNGLKGIDAYGIKEKMGVVIPVTTMTIAKAAGAKATEGVYLGTQYYWEVDTPAAKAFYEAYNSRWGYPPDAYANNAYIAAKELFRGIEGAGSLVAEDIGTYLDANPDYTGTLGPERWAIYHAPIRDVVVVRGKAPEDITGEWDIFEIVALKGYEPDDPWKYMPTPEELGY